MQRTSLSTLFYDPEAEPVPEPEQEQQPVPEPPKRRGRPPGSRNTPKPPPPPKRAIPWFIVWRAIFWAIVAVGSVVSLYWGVQGWLGQSAAYIVLAVSTLVAALLLDRDWKKMRS